MQKQRICLSILALLIISQGIVYPTMFLDHSLSVQALPPYYLLWTRTYGEPNNYTIALGVVEVIGSGFALTGMTDTPGQGDFNLWLIGTDTNGYQLWSQNYGGANDDLGTDLIEVSTGGYAVIGSTMSYGAGLYDAWLIRTDATGNTIWTQTYGGSEDDAGHSVVECSDGGFAIAGATSSSGAGDEDMWLIRTNADGDLQWAQNYGGAAVDRGFSLLERSGGGFAIVGITSSFGPIGVGYLVLTDANGNAQYQTVSTSTTQELWGELVECSNGGFAIAGWMTTTSGDRDYTLVRTNNTGSITWQQHYGGSFDDSGYALTQMTGGGFALTGHSESFSSGTGDTDIYLVCTDEDGTQTWDRKFGTTQTDQANAIIECEDRGLAIAGLTDLTSTDAPAYLIRLTDTLAPIPGFPWEATGIALIIALATGLARQRRKKT